MRARRVGGAGSGAAGGSDAVCGAGSGTGAEVVGTGTSAAADVDRDGRAGRDAGWRGEGVDVTGPNLSTGAGAGIRTGGRVGAPPGSRTQVLVAPPFRCLGSVG
ncbi:hypothetical protein Cpa01nite_34240 [Cellulomonas pakistanensis]|uniref:Uncharacterized protein n=1 Tax=Cellulomonas pakistanensis TaxID=992287 RepID=A0A919PE07_9CELL|nr:hypothetical protein Cpa01nite_34240 [Cellulomonas pakistanensis]